MLRKDIVIIEEFLKVIRSDDLKKGGWSKQTDKNGTKIYYRNEKEIKSITIYMEQEIDAPMINLFAFLSEIQLYPQWLPNTDSAVFLGEVSHFRKCAHFQSTMPWPFKQRESFLQGCGTFLEEENAIVMSMGSAKTNKWLGHKVKRNPKVAETDIHMQVVYLKALSKDRCKLTMMTNGDPHLTGIPQGVINFAIRNGVGEFLKMISEKSKNLPKIYYELIEKRRDYYDKIEQLIANLKIDE